MLHFKVSKYRTCTVEKGSPCNACLHCFIFKQHIRFSSSKSLMLVNTSTQWLSATCGLELTGPSCSKLTTSLKCRSNFKHIIHKNTAIFAKAPLIFSAKNISTLDFRRTRRLNESLTNDFVKLTMLWTTGPWMLNESWWCFSNMHFSPKLNIFVVN